jgi:hypothetical protein
MEFDKFLKKTESDGYCAHLDSEFAAMPPDLGGGTDLLLISAQIATAAGLEPLPIRVAHGSHHGVSSGYGIRHILLSHGEELASLEYTSVQDFLYDAVDFDAIYQGESRRWILAKYADSQLPEHRILVIERHRTKGCYCIVTGYTKDGGRKILKKLIWERRDRSPVPGPSSPR